MANMKKYILTGVVLGSIAAASGGLIALTNLITESKISKNEVEKLNNGIRNIFGEEASIREEKEISGQKYVTYSYKVENDKNDFLGYAFKCEGSNSYGKIILIAGFDKNDNFKSLFMIKDEQTYASTLEKKYVSSLNGGGNIEDVKCGATRGAELVRDMIKDSQDLAFKLENE